MFYANSRIVCKFVLLFTVQKYKKFRILKKNSTIKEQNFSDKNVEKVPELSCYESLKLEMERLMPYSPDVSRFTVLCRRSDYSAGTIARAIEDCNAHVLNLNLTGESLKEDMVAVDVRVDRKNIASIVRSLARFDYMVLNYADNEELITDTDRQRAAELLRYLEL